MKKLHRNFKQAYKASFRKGAIFMIAISFYAKYYSLASIHTF